MKTKSQLMLFLIVSFFLLCLLNNQRTEAVETSDYYTELDYTGAIKSGTHLESSRPTIRPEYQGTWGTLLNDITDSTGKAYFSKFNVVRNYKAGEYFYYNKVGSYNQRDLSLKVIFNRTESKPNYNFRTKLLSNGAIYIESMFDPLSKEISLEYQLVYSDTKEVVHGVDVELPQAVQTNAYNSGLDTYGYANFRTEGLSKVYFQQNKDIVSPTHELKTEKGTASGRELLKVIQDKRYTSLLAQNYVVYSNNEVPMSTGVNTPNAYAPYIVIFDAAIETPSTPNYFEPKIVGKKNAESLRASYTISQALTATYDIFYPDSLSVIIEDAEKAFTKITPDDAKIYNKDNKEITKETTIKQLDDHKLEITISNTLLKQLKSNAFQIELAIDSIDLKKADEFYDAETKQLNVPLSAYNVRKKANEKVQSAVVTGDANSQLVISGTPLPQVLNINSTTDDIDLDKVLADLKSNIPEDKVTVEAITDERLFDEVKKESVKVEVKSELFPQLTQTFPIQLNIEDTLVTTASLDNQRWLIDIAELYNYNKKVDRNLYISDLANVLDIAYVGNPNEQISIPKLIKYFINVDRIRILNSKFNTSLPSEIARLKKVTWMEFTNSSVTGEFPTFIKDMDGLSTLMLVNNKLTGKVPLWLFDLPNLKDVSIKGNEFVGQIPLSIKNEKLELNISNNQLTYNSDEIPAYVKNSDNTFLKGLQLSGSEILSIADKTKQIIKPFDTKDAGYFNLHVIGQESDKINALYDGHHYTILNEETNEVLYDGPKSANKTIPYKKGIIYKVILDEAIANPRNQTIIKTKIPELKLEKIPELLSFDISLGTHLKKPVKLIGEMSIFDNRDGGNWQLNITPSSLESETKTLKGEYSYINQKGIETAIIAGQKAPIEKGKSDTEDEIIPISDMWTDKYGLQFTINGSNYLGSYKGSVTWTLENVPSSN
ncbi:hypothetical protein IGJ02_002191 [Enterococcus sp. DIV0724b]|uniref:hypothetical protein n=1 Tax=Enterococcus sp. DIV0724b TaxID=2774694 RepID=UPI003D300AD9